MIVTPETLADSLHHIRSAEVIAIDTETTGLSESDSLFSIPIATATREFYFDIRTLPPGAVDDIARAVRTVPLVAMINAKFDLRMLGKAGIELEGVIHDCEAVERVLRNDHLKYSMAAMAARRGWEKSDAVEEYITKHGLFDTARIPGKKKVDKRKHFDKVPIEVIAPYGCQDARLTFDIYTDQMLALRERDASLPKGFPPWRPVVDNERAFTKTAFRMERHGVRVDVPFVEKALAYEMEKISAAKSHFLEATGREFSDSNKLLAEVFTSLGETFPTTEKGNPSFKAEVLEGMETPVAKLVNTIRYHEKRAGTYYSSFLHYADESGIIRPNVRQAGTETGRCSYSDPNLQNVPKEDEPEDQDTLYHVRESFIPRPGHFFYSIDYQQQEFRIMLDYAGEKRLIEEINAGADVHEATAQLCGITRKQAKTINFGLLYGMGEAKLAQSLRLTTRQARELKLTYFGKLPRVEIFIREVIRAGERRGYIYNWLGRRNHITSKDWAYVLPNHLIQGSAADTIKVAQNRVADMLLSRKSPTMMLLQVHDELLIETPYGDERIIEPVREIMESVYPSKNGMRLTTSIEHSVTNWGYRQKLKGVPYGTAR